MSPGIGAFRLQQYKRALGILAFLVFPLMTSCLERREPEICTDYFHSAARQDARIFRGMSLDQQLTIHECGLTRRPPTDYSYYIAERGPGIASALIARLEKWDGQKTFDADRSRYAVILVFKRLINDGQIALDGNLFKRLKRSANDIGTDWIKTEAESSMRDIAGPQQK